MTRAQIIDTLGLDEEETLFMDGYDDCIAGAVMQFGRPAVVCYDYEKVIASHMKDGMDREEAIEFFEFNQLGAWVGESTPCFINTLPKRGRGRGR